MKREFTLASVSISNPSSDEILNKSKNAHGKPQVYNFFKSLLCFCLQFLRLPSWLSRRKDSFSDMQSVESLVFETGGTIENMSFKRTFTSQKSVPLTYESIEKSILSEMKTCGSARLLHEIISAKSTNTILKLDVKGVSLKELNVALLWSALHKKWELEEVLLESGADLSYSERLHGLSALHIAAFSGCTEGTQLLIMKNANVNAINKWYSPLHCAVLARKLDIARILLDNGARINSMTNGPRYETPLFLAVKIDDLDCVKLFVDRGAQIYQEGKMGCVSPLFLAAELGHAKCLKVILNARTVNCNVPRRPQNGNTALHIAAEGGHSECIELLLDYKADPNVTNSRCQTPLHLAVKANSYTSVVILIRKGGANPNLQDYHKRTPLHEAVELIAVNRRDIVKGLIENGSNVNAQDQHGFTPLHIAAINELAYCVSILIKHGADCSIRSHSGVTAFSLIAKKLPYAFDAIKEQLTDSITLVYHSHALNDVEMRFDFKNGLHHPKEYSILNAFIDSGHKEMLLHPFIKIFLYVTWSRIRRCYYGMIYNSLIFSIVLLSYVLTSLAYDCDRVIQGNPNNTTTHCTNRSYLNKLLKSSPLTLEIQWYILLYFTLTLAYRKIYGFHGYPSIRHYCINWSNVLEWQGIVFVFVISFIYTGRVESWQVYAGAFAVILSWTNIMYLIGQLPAFGPYVEMFQKVQSEFQKLLLVFFPFLIGFTIGFCIIFPNSLAFNNPLIGFLSALVMMTGEMNYEILLNYSRDENSSNLARFCAQAAYTFFLLFITIILMNLLVGIAVHDIQGLQKNADLSRLVRQAKVCSYIEMSHYKRSALAKTIMTFLRVIPKPYVPVLSVKPLDSEDIPVLKQIIQDAYKLAKKKEAEKEDALRRTRSETGPWNTVLRGGFGQKYLSGRSGSLSHLAYKMDKQKIQIKNLQQDIIELKEIVKSGYHTLP